MTNISYLNYEGKYHVFCKEHKKSFNNGIYKSDDADKISDWLDGMLTCKKCEHNQDNIHVLPPIGQ